jgi:hypothetical protein
MSGQKPEVEEKESLAAEEVPEAEKTPAAAEEKKIQARLALGVRDRALAEQHAAELTRRGFSVVKAAARGVSFEGAPELFQSTFESGVKVGETPSFEQEPKLPEELREDVDSVYFPTRPIFYGKERRR